MKILVVGGGGREHAIAAALSRNKEVRIYSVMAKNNPGIAGLSERVMVTKETDAPEIADFACESGIDYAFIGPEAPLEAGVVDLLDEKGIPSVGPTRAAARLETDKAFCREMMAQHGIAGCPRYRVCHDPEEAVAFIQEHEGDLAIKPIGLTGGKGVRIMGEHVDRSGAIAYVRQLGGEVVIEERLIGEEFTLQAFVDGTRMVTMPLVQDHKRAYEGDEGPNTGGMGSYSMPDHLLPFVTQRDVQKAKAIMKDTIAAMNRTGQPYKGILYGQFMNTRDGPVVIEFNARFGDPEAMNVLSILGTDLAETGQRLAEGTLSEKYVSFEKKATVCKYLVPDGYPEAPVTGSPVTIGPTGNALLYYANVTLVGGHLVTLSSRTLAFVGVGETLAEAESVAETAASGVRGRVRHRADIGTAALLKRRIDHMKELT